MKFSIHAYGNARRNINDITPNACDINSHNSEQFRAYRTIAAALILLAITVFCINPGQARADDSNAIVSLQLAPHQTL